LPGGSILLLVPDQPPLSVLLPVLNEADAIDGCLASLADQDYPGRWSLVVADGGSTDGTRRRLEAWRSRLPELIVMDNPLRLQSHGLNRAAEAARGEILVRVDAHTTYHPDYLSRSVEGLLSTGAVAVGGALRPEGTTGFGRAVAAAMGSPLAIGPGTFHHTGRRREADTVYLGTFRKDDFMEIGGYRAFPSGVAEDADLFFRWRRAHRTVLFDPDLRSVYRPRETARTLARQFWRYGLGKADMLYVNGRWPSWRPLAPLALVTGLLVTAGLAVAGRFKSWFWLLLGAWLVAIFSEGVRIARSPLALTRTVLAIAIMHLAYGAGLLAGLLRSPGRVRRAVVHLPPQA